MDADTIRYQFTVEDPGMWVAPWSGEYAIRRFEGPIYRYACHEGNYGLSNILSAARVAEREAPARADQSYRPLERGPRTSGIVFYIPHASVSLNERRAWCVWINAPAENSIQELGIG